MVTVSHHSQGLNGYKSWLMPGASSQGILVWGQISSPATVEEPKLSLLAGSLPKIPDFWEMAEADPDPLLPSQDRV